MSFIYKRLLKLNQMREQLGVKFSKHMDFWGVQYYITRVMLLVFSTVFENYYL